MYTGQQAPSSHEDRFVSDVPNMTVSPRNVPRSASMATGNRSSRMRGRLAAHGRSRKERKVAVSPSTARPSFRDVFTHPEFRALWVSYVLSAAGDRLALVALTLLVYSRSKSPLLAAMIALLYAVTLLQPPFDASRSAIVRDVMEQDRYPLAMAVMGSTSRVVIMAGSAAGGLIVALFGARLALGADAATFVASAVVIQFGVHARPAPAAGDGGQKPLGQLADGVRLVFGDPALRALMSLGWLAAFYEVPEGLAAPYAGSLKGGAVAAGLLIAASQLGAAVTTPLFTKKIGPLTRLQWMGPMAVLTCGILAVTVLRPNLVVSLALFALSNSFAMYQVAANTAFVERIPNEKRGQAFGLANAGLIVGQGLAFAVAGAAAEVVPPSTVVALSGGVGALIAGGLAFRWRGMSPAVGRHTARHLGREASLTRRTPIQSGSL